MKQVALHQWHKEHTKRITEFHKNHEMKILRGENGNGLLAKWERFFITMSFPLLKNKILIN
ncbi:hypothetical protein [Bacillus sp. 7884-1]|uniref:hypothetical protein n=1 Tax=Bacillus sp. 7884-1 TaxID=2021693 RepID=UPI000BA6DBCE|nr:hypothetical protein [Bacillus sp. 7884-1]PAE37750.1 hypothetical protein CHI06_19885 [Bacillus sp. 7884-1]